MLSAIFLTNVGEMWKYLLLVRILPNLNCRTRIAEQKFANIIADVGSRKGDKPGPEVYYHSVGRRI